MLRVLGIGLTVWLSGCAGQTEAALPAGPAEVTVNMAEYRFDFDRKVDRRSVSFRVVNKGALGHDLTLIRVPSTLRTSLDAQLRGPERLYVVPIAQLKIKKPGQEGIFAVDLAPGRYGMICFVGDPDGVQHARKGMSKEFRIA